MSIVHVQQELFLTHVGKPIEYFQSTWTEEWEAQVAFFPLAFRSSLGDGQSFSEIYTYTESVCNFVWGGWAQQIFLATFITWNDRTKFEVSSE